MSELYCTKKTTCERFLKDPSFILHARFYILVKAWQSQHWFRSVVLFMKNIYMFCIMVCE